MPVDSRYDIKWENDLKTYIRTFKSFIFEGNVNDLQPVLMEDRYEYLPLKEAIFHLLKEKYCVVYFDHTRKSGALLPDDEGNTGDEADDDAGGPNVMGEEQEPVNAEWFNSFIFAEEEEVSSDGKVIKSPGIDILLDYYRKDYMDRISERTANSMQGNITVDMRRMLDVVTDFDEKVEKGNYPVKPKPFLFILPNVSRYMTVPGSPDTRENSILMTLFNATQVDSSCRIALFVDKANDLPTWFESENTNSAVKKIFIPVPNNKFRETFYRAEMTEVMEPIPEEDEDSKVKTFSAFTENYSLRRLLQLKEFVVNESDDEKNSYLKNVNNIAKTTMKFEIGEDYDPWKDKSLRDIIRKLPKNLKENIKGQGEAVDTISKALKTASAGVNSSDDNRKPRAVFFFAGPTGTGKTEMAKQVAEKIFKSKDSIIRFDMSEFRQEHTDSRLFGAPPGYVGYESGGELTRAIKQRPFTIVLFDEIEKANAKIWDKFLQILGDGRLTDGKGESVSFTHSIIIFTSNLGMTPSMTVGDDERLQMLKDMNEDIAKALAEASSDPSHKDAHLSEALALLKKKSTLTGIKANFSEEKLFTEHFEDLGADNPTTAFNAFVRECVKERIENYFESIGRREVYGRIGDENVIVFNFISKKAAYTIAENRINKFAKYLRTENESHLNLEVSDEAREFIVNNSIGTDIIELGARGIVNHIDRVMSEPVSDFIFDNEGDGLSATMVLEEGILRVRKN